MSSPSSSSTAPQVTAPSFGRLGIAALPVVTPPPGPYRRTPERNYHTRITPGRIASHHRDGQPPTTTTAAADVMLQDAKRREREQGPAIMSLTMRAPKKKAPPPSLLSATSEDDLERKSQGRIDHFAATPGSEETRQSKERSILGSTTQRPRSKEYKSTGTSTKHAADDALDAAKRRERNRGPILTPSNSVLRPDTSYSSASTKPHSDALSSTTTAFNVARDDLAKRQERERGPSLFSAMVTPRQRQSLQTSNKMAASNQRVGATGSTSINDSDISAIKRRERESGPALACATGSSPFAVATARRRTPTTPSSNDPMEDVKRRERERNSGRWATNSAPAFVRSTPPRSSHGDATTSSPPSKPSKSVKTDSRVVFDVDEDEGSTDDTAYALAMARTNLERKMQHEQGTSRDNMVSTGSASANAMGLSNEIRPGASIVSGRDCNAKVEADDTGPSLAPAVGIAPPRISPRSPARASTSNLWSNTTIDIEAQAGVPLVTPGAFAVHGVSSRESDYTSSEDSDDDYHSVTDNGFDDVDGTFAPDTPLEAEVYEQVILDGAVVTSTDEEEELVDPKVLKRLRFVQLSMLAFALCAISVIIGSILGFKSNDKTSGPPTVQGWNRSGVDIFGPTSEPQTLFGSAVAVRGMENVLRLHHRVPTWKPH